MSLTNYNKKRNFEETAEPAGKKVAKKADELVFVVQRHKATRLHYDFRLELQGVLKSWAVPKGPSLNPTDKRLAMMVEDHPFDYKDFEGIIPAGNYGAGIVEIWDRGTYTSVEDKKSKKDHEKVLLKGLGEGNLKVKLNGQKLKGEFAVVKLKNEDDNSWLLIKHRDSFSIDSNYNAEDDTPEDSPINEYLANKSKKKNQVKKKPRLLLHLKLQISSINLYLPCLPGKRQNLSQKKIGFSRLNGMVTGL